MPSADEWWSSLPFERREQIYRWVTQTRGGYAAHPPTPGQRALFTETEVEPE